MLAAIAWRNIWRNARRSLITMSALSLGVAGIVGLYSYREIANEAIVRDITTGLLGHIQIHGLGYQEAPAIGTLVPHALQVEAALLGALPGAKAERRVIGAGLAGAGDRSAPVMVLGVEPQTTGLYRLDQGRPMAAKGEVMIGRELAKDLEIGPGSELVLVSQAADGSVANDRYLVAGTFVSSSSEMDASALALPIEEAQSFFALGDGVHQLVVRLPTDKEDVSTQLGTLRAALDLKTLEALSWSQMLPEIKASMDAKRKSQSAMDLVIALIVGLGVFNAMTMSVFERTREFGVLMSVGTRPRRLLGMVLLEALWQGAIAYGVGVLLASAVLYGVGTVDLGAQLGGDMMGVRLPDHLTLGLFPASLSGAAITVFVAAILGALVPAVRAARLKPVEALRHT